MTESYYIHIDIKMELYINDIQSMIFNTIRLSMTKSSTCIWAYEEALNSTSDNIKDDFYSYYNKINFDYTGNEHSIPASVFVNFYSNSLNNKSRQFCISGFNKPGSDFINAKYKVISNHLFKIFTEENLLPKIIHTFDSAYQTPELFRIYNHIKSKTGIRDIVT
ncbi:hypothetical protein Hsw_3190 [Hymenobacter swuensis DY53]|uniref:Uncharacterized protein n=1 Tax=Hymenobacter swuensis DY53 TaxID=1227739 RepID=W8FAQ1_9BACT|nr:hypothetical protein Hsw_3190 [Hymenobacter swuensis DY53]